MGTSARQNSLMLEEAFRECPLAHTVFLTWLTPFGPERFRSGRVLTAERNGGNFKA